ncbi:hypothetical protein [Chryseobacterium taiwanense]|uniref:hypothetical protein n=1 Tax=Chryseobacterium taiwanense TaxID=363331 RepID=UPI001E5C68B7|nr:hypothetical protein [Chryseobacterium taiwanense]
MAQYDSCRDSTGKSNTGWKFSDTLNEVTLSTTDQLLVSNTSLGTKQSLNIDDSISAEKASKVLQTITYTAIAL